MHFNGYVDVHYAVCQAAELASLSISQLFSGLFESSCTTYLSNTSFLAVLKSFSFTTVYGTISVYYSK